MILLRILLTIFLIILILLLLIIFIPYRYRFKSDELEEGLEARIFWLFGILKISYLKYMDKTYEDEFIITIFSIDKQIQSKDRTEKVKTEKKEKKKKRTSISLNKVTKGVIDKGIILVKSLWGHIKPDRIYGDLQIGFSDPMHTGLLYGLYCSLSYLIGDNFNLSPIFEDRGIRGKFLVEGQVWVLALLVAFIRFIFSPPVRKEIRFKNKRRDARHVR